MYKHHSYNNLIEGKLEQLPPPDADHLWGSMEAMLDQHLPQKKRRPPFFAWLFAHKAWMLMALFAVAAGSTSLIYFSGQSHPVVQHTPVRNTATQHQTATASASAREASAGVQEAKASDAAPIAASTQVINTSNQHTGITAVAAPQPSSATAPSSAALTSVRGDKHPVSDRQDNIDASTASTFSGNPQVRSASEASFQPAADPSEALRWATTTHAMLSQEKIIPAINADSVTIDQEMLQHLSQQIAAQKMGRLPQEKGFYAGVTVGLDMSTVKLQSVQTGRNQGLVVGYAFNNHWSIESGLLWNKKRFYDNGSNFKPDDYTPNPSVNITGVNCVSQLYEWPVSVRYNILPGAHKLFAAAGLSSYYMKKETYNLEYEWNGQGGYNEYDEYSNATKNWFSVASFSMGYSQKLGSFGSFRVEPYLKLPLRDLGVCNMRVTSMGLNVGFTKTLKR